MENKLCPTMDTDIKIETLSVALYPPLIIGYSDWILMILTIMENHWTSPLRLKSQIVTD